MRGTESSQKLHDSCGVDIEENNIQQVTYPEENSFHLLESIQKVSQNSMMVMVKAR